MVVNLKYDYKQSIARLDKFSQSDIDELKQWTLNVDTTKCIPRDLAKDVKPYLDVFEFAFFPEPSREGYDIIFCRLGNTDPAKFSLEAGAKLFFMTVDACLYKRGPKRGYIFLFDMKGAMLRHIAKFSLSSLRKFFQYVQEACPIRMRAIHVLNTEPILDKFLLNMKPFMNKQLYVMLKFHNKNIDMEEFYEKHIPRSALPSDFGGSLTSVRDLHAACILHLADIHISGMKRLKHALLYHTNIVINNFKK